jgi:hypothetical protein
MIHKVADLLQYRSLAMLLSISLTRLPDMNARDRVMAYAESVTNYFGNGACWENFRGYCRSLTPYCGPNGRRNHNQWAFIAARLFFSDLTQLCCSEKLSLEGRQQYTNMAAQLLSTVWSRLVTTGKGLDIERCRERSADTLAGVSYELDEGHTPYLCSQPEDPNDPFPIFDAVVICPEFKQLNLACNSFDVESCGTRRYNHPNKECRSHRVLEGDFAKYWDEVVDRWIEINLHWGAKSVMTNRENIYRWGHDGHLEMPGNEWEAQKWREKGKTPEKNIPVSPVKPSMPPHGHRVEQSTDDRSVWKFSMEPPFTPRGPMSVSEVGPSMVN